MALEAIEQREEEEEVDDDAAELEVFIEDSHCRYFSRLLGSRSTFVFVYLTSNVYFR